MTAIRQQDSLTTKRCMILRSPTENEDGIRPSSPKSPATTSFPHAFSGNPGGIQNGPPIKTFRGDGLGRCISRSQPQFSTETTKGSDVYHPKVYGLRVLRGEDCRFVLHFVVLILVILFFALFTSAVAQEKYPDRPITIVAPFPPGGVADLTARPVAAALEKVLKNPVVVVNKTGAAGAVGMAFVANSKPDGYNLLMALSSISIIPEADKLFDRQPAYTMDQLNPIALISADPTIFVVSADRPWKSVKEFVEDAKKRPGQISYSSSGVYGTLHMATEMLSHAAAISLKHVPYSGAGPALTAILGGHVDTLASGPAVVIPHIKAGKLRPLAGWGAKRVASLPDVPTFKEVGYDIEFYIWAGLFAPRGMPAPVMKTIRAAVKQAVDTPEFKSAMEKIQTPIAYLDAPEFQKFWDKDAKMLADAIKRVGKVEIKETK
jgi:tripartite-type tricarboxylate transporter receptor subunit TctC